MLGDIRFYFLGVPITVEVATCFEEVALDVVLLPGSVVVAIITTLPVPVAVKVETG